MKLLETGYASEIYEHPEDPDSKLLLVTNDRFSCPGWPNRQSIEDLGRVRTAIASSIYEHLQGRFATAYLGAGSWMPGRTLELSWYESVPISIQVIGYSSAATQAYGHALLTGKQTDAGEGSALETPLVLLVRAQQLPTQLGVLDEQGAQSLVKASLIQRMRLAALVLYADLKVWYGSKGLVLGSMRFDFGVTGEELLLTGQPGLLEFLDVGTSELGLGRAGFSRWIEEMGSLDRASVAELGGRIHSSHVDVYERLSGRAFATWSGEPSRYEGQRASRGILRRR